MRIGGRTEHCLSVRPSRKNEQLNPATYHTTRTTFSDPLPREIHPIERQKAPGYLALGTYRLLLDIQRHPIVSSVPLLEFEILTSS